MSGQHVFVYSFLVILIKYLEKKNVKNQPNEQQTRQNKTKQNKQDPNGSIF